MNVIDGRGKSAPEKAADSPPLYFDSRGEFAQRFLSGEGLEIGALHQPLAVPPQARVRYVDRMKVDGLRAEYPELADWDLTSVDVIDDGEALTTVKEASQDFIVANHFLEHCEDPIGTIKAHLSKLKPGGILFYAVPDKRYTFDFARPLTPTEHMVEDHERGPERSRAEHYEEWARFIPEAQSQGNEGLAARTEEEVMAEARRLEEVTYSIHMHVWTQAEFLRLILHCRERFDEAFDIEAAARRGFEFIVVLRKSGPFPEPFSPAPAASTASRAELEARNRWRTRIRRALGAARRELRRVI
jgi:SAM-dependent methyltransferase